jgi:hypothetical protein
MHIEDEQRKTCITVKKQQISCPRCMLMRLHLFRHAGREDSKLAKLSGTEKYRFSTNFYQKRKGALSA